MGKDREGYVYELLTGRKVMTLSKEGTNVCEVLEFHEDRLTGQDELLKKTTAHFSSIDAQ